VTTFRALDWVQDHPYSIHSTKGFFPVKWEDLIDDHPWNRSVLVDPDEWLIVPDFGVVPAEVRFAGFDLPLSCSSYSVPYGLPELVSMARRLVRKTFSSMPAVIAALDSTGDAERLESAELYEAVIFSLAAILDPRLGADEQVEGALEVGGLLSAWALEGPGSAHAKLSAGGKRGATKSILARRSRSSAEDPALDVRAVVEAARKRGWPGAKYGLLKALARDFNRTPTRIGQILRAQRKLENEGG
jgi:hypothetical protein